MSDENKTHIHQVLEQLNRVLLGKPEQIKLAVACLLANGHLLIEDLPGMGKTTLSHALANAFGLHYQRVQFTSDMLPADLIGISIFDKQKGDFEFHPGPIFHQLLLADEINRANPKTQSALLEAMEEQQVSVDGNTHALPKPFFVIATQNPVHQSGTFPLPESQLDRFLMRLQLGYPPKSAELELLQQGLEGKQTRAEQIKPNLVDKSRLQHIQAEVRQVKKSDAALTYVLALLEYSRKGDFPNQLSPRAGLAIVAAAQAYSYIEGRGYITPDDIKAVFTPVTEHRLRAGFSAGLNTQYSQQILDAVDPLA